MFWFWSHPKNTVCCEGGSVQVLFTVYGFPPELQIILQVNSVF